MRLPSWLAQHLAALRALLVFTVLLGLAYPLAMVAVAQIPGLSEPAPTARSSSQNGNGRRQRAHRPVVHRRRRQPARRSTSSPGRPRPATATTRPPPRPATSARRASSTPCPTRPTRTTPASRACSPRSAPAARRRRAGGRRRAPAVLHRRTASARCSRVFHRDGLTGPVTRVVSLNQACPATPFLSHVRGRHGGVRQVRRGLLARAWSRRSAATRRPTPAVPADAVTASGSGLDPHISPAYADAAGAPGGQGPRHRRSARSTALIDEHTTGRFLGLHRRAGGQRAASSTWPSTSSTRPRLTGDRHREGGRTHGTRTAARLPRGRPRRRQDVQDAGGGPPAQAARHRRRRRLRRDPRPARSPRRCSAAWRWCPAGRSTYRGRRRSPRWTSTRSWPARPEVVARRRAGPHQRARLPQRQALAGHRGAARRRHHRADHGQHPAPGVAQRRRRADHRRAAARDRARRGRPPGRAGRTGRHDPGGAAPADGPRQHLPAGEGRRRAGQLLPRRQPHRAARAGPALAGRQGRRPARPVPGRARHRRHLGGPRTGRRRAHRRPRGRHPASAAAARIAARTKGADLLAVHVARSDGLAGADPANLARQRVLVESLGGTYHQVVGDDIPTRAARLRPRRQRHPARARRQPPRPVRPALLPRRRRHHHRRVRLRSTSTWSPTRQAKRGRRRLAAHPRR